MSFQSKTKLCSFSKLSFRKILIDLDAFGFLVYGDKEDSFDGNQGLKDQQLALEWVRDNIEYFGGDKEMVSDIVISIYYIMRLYCIIKEIG